MVYSGIFEGGTNMPIAPESEIHACECSICQTACDSDVMHQHDRINILLSRLTEPQRRWYVGFLSQAPESPGDRQLARITGLDRNTIRRGRRELVAGLVGVA